MPTEIRVTWLLLITHYLKPQLLSHGLISAGCELYAFCGALFGICSMITLTVIAIDRYFVITRPLTSIGVLSRKRAFVILMTVWIYSLGWSLPPFFGWSGDTHAHMHAHSHKHTHTHTDAEMHTHDPVKATLNLTVAERALFPHRTLKNVAKKDVQGDPS